MGSYITASYEVKCMPDEAFHILSYIDKVNGLHDFSFERNLIGNKGVLKAYAWSRRLGVTDHYDEINLCRKLTLKFPNIRIWLHTCYETGNYEFSEYLFSNGEIEGGFSYDDEFYKKYSHEFESVVEEGCIEEMEDATKLPENHPVARMEKEFCKIEEGDIIDERFSFYCAVDEQ